MKILFQTVGTGKSGEDIARALAKVIAAQNPERVVFLASPKTREVTVPHVVRFASLAEQRYEVKECSEQDDVEVLASQYATWMAEEARRERASTIVVDYTSGTKAMSAAAIIAGLRARVSAFVYVSGKRDAEGRVAPGTERILYQGSGEILAPEALRLASAAFRAFQNEAVIEQLQPWVAEERAGRYRGEFSTLVRLARAYAAWDSFRLKDACKLLDEILSNDEAKETLASWDARRRVEENRRFLDEALTPDRSPLLIVDLIANSRRRAAVGRPDDAVGRLYRATEALLQVALRRRDPSIDTSKVDVEGLPEDVRSKWRDRKPPDGDRKLKIGLEKAAELLRDVGDPLGDDVVDGLREGELKKCLHQRNHSILAHGFGPVDAEFAGRFDAELCRLLDRHFGRLVPGSKWDRLLEMATFVDVPLPP